MMLALTAASSHPDCRAVLTQIVALHFADFELAFARAVAARVAWTCPPSVLARADEVI